MVVGLRGIPNVQGGVETHAQHLYPRLAALGCDVEILVRSPYVSRGNRCFGAVRLRRIWSPRTIGLEALVHTLVGVLYAGVRRPEILHIHAVGPAIAAPLARLLGLRVVVTHHGPDYDRDKWGSVARQVLLLGERVGMRFANARIAISNVISELIVAKYGLPSVLIPNGVVAVDRSANSDYVRRLGLVPGKYFVNVGRFVPEKRQLDLIAAYRLIAPCDWRLALVGAIGADSYSRDVRAAADHAGIVMTGMLTGEALTQVYSHAGAFVLPSAHEGLPIAMLEALSFGLPVIASDIPANQEIGLDESSYFAVGDVQDLSRALVRIMQVPQSEAAIVERRTFVAARYNWDRIAEQTLRVYEEVLSSSRS